MFGQNTISSEEMSLLKGKFDSIILHRSYTLYNMGTAIPHVVRRGVSSLEEAAKIAKIFVERGNVIAVIEDSREMKPCGTVKLSGVIDRS